MCRCWSWCRQDSSRVGYDVAAGEAPRSIQTGRADELKDLALNNRAAVSRPKESTRVVGNSRHVVGVAVLCDAIAAGVAAGLCKSVCGVYLSCQECEQGEDDTCASPCGAA